MEFYQLRTFAAVANEGNLSRAAKSLAASQPAVSAQIKALEDELGVPLFRRTPRGMLLTTEGSRLLENASKLLKDAEELRELARSLQKNPEGTVRIISLADPAILRLGELLSLSSRRYPGLHLEMLNASSGSVRQQVLAGDCDCGFVLGPSEDDLEREALCPMGLVVVLPPTAPEHASWKDVLALPWIGTTPDCPIQQLSQELFTKQGSAPRQAMQVDIERTLIEMVAAGLGAGLVREDTARWAHERSKCRIWDGARIETEFALIWKRSRRDDPAVAAIRALVEELWTPMRNDAAVFYSK
jgi:DNA-binding transcriptional LysR family regulator